METAIRQIEVNKEKLVQELKKGVDTRKQIIESHLLLVLHIASAIAIKYPQHKSDLESEALLAMVKAVDRVKNQKFKLHDDNITPYIAGCVKPALKRYIVKSHLISVPPETVAYNKRHNIETVFEKIVQTEINKAGKKYDIGLEIQELVELSITNEVERVVVELRLQNHTFDEIAQKCGYTDESWARKIFDTFRNRFKKLWEE